MSTAADAEPAAPAVAEPAAPAAAPTAAAPAATTATNATAATESFDAIEKNVGIRTYLTADERGFAAVVKARYSDFLVGEVNTNGEIARLEKLEPEKEPQTEEEKKKEEEESKKRKLDVETTVEDDLAAAQKDLSALVGEETAAKVTEMILYWEHSTKPVNEDKRKKSKPNEDADKEMATDEAKPAVDDTKEKEKAPEKEHDKFIVLPKAEKKETRTAIHQFVRNNIAKYAVGDTQEGCIRIWHKKFERQMPNFGKFDRPGKARNDRKKGWPSDRPDFLQFVLYKENIDTGSATKDILRRLKGKGRLGFSGMKDKRGVTTQFCTLYRRTPQEIMSFNGNKSNWGGGSSTYGGVSVLKVGNFKYVNKELTLGMLKGNRFDVVLRNVDTGHDNLAESRKTVEQAAKAFQQNGFINYFGMQRFGKDHDTHKVGIEILKGNYKAAVEMIMRPKPNEKPHFLLAREKWRDRFESVPDDEAKRKEVEKSVASLVVRDMGRFMACEQNLLNCLKRDPLNYKKAFSHIPKHMRLMFLHAVQSVIWNQVASMRLETMGTNVCVGDLVQTEDAGVAGGGSGTSGRRGKAVKVVTQEDVDKKTYDITDVVLPLVGNRIEYPENETGKLFDTLLIEWDITKSSFDNFKDRELTLGGDYRKIVIKPSDVDFTISEYADPLQPLVQTDLMKVNKQEVPKATGDAGDKKLMLGMVVGFTLPPSSYATIALRELTKRPTSSEYQRQLQLEGPCEGKLLAVEP